jgi:hypothetical protein
VFKSGDKADYKNYRPISLLPSFSKIFEKLMHNCLFLFLKHNNILNTKQHGFWNAHNTTTALAALLDFVTAELDNDKYVLGLFLDVAIAFDSLNHSILLNKLEIYGVRGVALQWFPSYLSNKFQ